MAEVSCPNCGRPNSDHREFCDFCGNPLDGALPYERIQPQQGDSQMPGDPDEASRLDSLMSAPDEPIPTSSPDDFLADDSLNGASRLDSFLADQDDDPEKESFAETFDEGSRLDDYLSEGQPPTESRGQIDGGDDSSRLDEYLPAAEPEDDLPLDLESLSGDQEDDTSRLDEYLPPEPPAQQEADEASRLDDFFADDPFKRPDPFREPPASVSEEKDPFQDPFTEKPAPSAPVSQDQEPDEGFISTRDDLLSESAPPQPSPEEDLPDIAPETSQPGEDSSPAAAEVGEWDFLDPTPTPETAGAQSPPPSADSEEWEFLDPSPEPEQPQAEQPSTPPDAGEWDFLDPTPAPEPAGDESPPPSADSEDWGFLDPTPDLEQPQGEQPSGPPDPGEWDFLDPAPGPDQPAEDGSPDPIDAGEWGFLDPSPPEPGPEEKSAGSDTPDDWSFLDPGPADDLPDDEGLLDYAPEEEGEQDAGWLDMLQDPGSRERGEPEAGPPAEPSKPQTDWLDKIKRLNKSSELVDEDSSFPDWLSVTGKTAELKEEDQIVEPGPEEGTEDVPAWLNVDDDDESLNEFLRKKDLIDEEYKPKFTTDSLEDKDVPTEEDEIPSGLSDSQQIKFPSWAEEEKKKAQSQKDMQFMAAYEDAPAGSTGPFQVEEEFFDDLFSEELPNWLTAASSGEVVQIAGEDLAQGELPGWVEAMRPVVESTDASGLGDDEDYIENYGPLAGIPSVLPAEPEIGIDFDQAVQKPLDLLATKGHQDYVDLLKKLIGDENKSKTILRPSPLQTQRVLRWLISIIMLVAIAGTLIFAGTAEAEAPAAAQVQGTGFGALYEEIDKLYDGQPVLIAYDYQPATAGELHTAAASVVDHLMEQGAYLSIISTVPTGPALAEQFLDATQSEHQYIHTQKYINLGYLPGESAGLVSFMIAPQKIIPLAFDGSNAWDSPPLISVDMIEDFKMVLVITDDPNTAKIWIEQVGTRLEETPLTMIVSAQVEPLIQPYFRTSPRQLTGYVAGIIDSMNYEQLTGKPNLATKLWLPFNMGIVISVGIIFISGLANGVLSLFSRRQEMSPGESK